jgi:ABC-type phosphate transport system substrate-binding protein
MKARIVMIMVLAMLMAGPVFAEMTIIANPLVPDTIISGNDLKEIFLGKRVKWSDNSRIVFVLSEDANAHKAFLDQYVGRSPSQFDMHWRNMLFTGQAQLPMTLKSEQEIIDFVSKTPGALGYVGSPPASNTVKQLTIK